MATYRQAQQRTTDPFRQLDPILGLSQPPSTALFEEYHSFSHLHTVILQIFGAV